MSGQLGFPGGIGVIDIADASDFDTAANSTFVVNATRNMIADGTDFPNPESVTVALADDREVGTGVDQPITIHFTDLPTTDFDSLEQARVDGTEVWIRVQSVATTSGGNLKWMITYKKVILSHTAHGPVRTGRDEFGVVLIEGMTTGSRSDDIYSLQQDVAAP